MKIEVTPINDVEFVIDLSDISHRERVSVDMKKNSEERIEEISKNVSEHIAMLVKLKIRLYLNSGVK